MAEGSDLYLEVKDENEYFATFQPAHHGVEDDIIWDDDPLPPQSTDQKPNCIQNNSLPPPVNETITNGNTNDPNIEHVVVKKEKSDSVTESGYSATPHIVDRKVSRDDGKVLDGLRSNKSPVIESITIGDATEYNRSTVIVKKRENGLKSESCQSTPSRTSERKSSYESGEVIDLCNSPPKVEPSFEVKTEKSIKTEKASHSRTHTSSYEANGRSPGHHRSSSRNDRHSSSRHRSSSIKKEDDHRRRRHSSRDRSPHRRYSPHRRSSSRRSSSHRRYPSPVGHDLPVRYRLPMRQYSPVRHHSPVRHYSPSRHRSPRRHSPPRRYSPPGRYHPPSRYSPPRTSSRYSGREERDSYHRVARDRERSPLRNHHLPTPPEDENDQGSPYPHPYIRHDIYSYQTDHQSSSTSQVTNSAPAYSDPYPYPPRPNDCRVDPVIFLGKANSANNRQGQRSTNKVKSRPPPEWPSADEWVPMAIPKEKRKPQWPD